AHHTLRLADAEQVGATSAIDLTDPDKTRLLLLCRQLDLRSFFHRATLYELDRGPRWRWLRRLGPLRETLQDMLWLMARFSYLDRQHRLAHDKELCFEPVDEPQLRDEGRLDVVRDPWAALRVETATAARRISRFRAFGRGLLPETHEWSLWYYTACVHALVIRDRPEPVVAGVEAVIESTRLTQWKRRYDPIAEFAVRALNHAIMVRGMKSLTLVEAGARDWMLYEDPDLDKLRKHPRFQRWASATFSIDTLHYGSDEQKMDAQVARLRQDEWSTDGIYGSVERWGPWSRRWWIANDTYLASSVLGVTPHIIQRWRTLAREVNQPAQVEQRAEALLDLVTQDVDAWRSLACYRRLAARLDLRLQASHRLATLAGGTLAHAAFPTYATVLQHPMTLDYRQLDDVLERLIAEAELSARRLRHGLRHPHLDQVDLDFSAEFVAAAQRWQRLHDHVERAVGR
ncbi:MAG TPA: hypothetical protein VHN80_22210, partial [Kineosporiaceae bacterium]|nr:hypothetical protein [Kineosporiaceae bacterium]